MRKILLLTLATVFCLSCAKEKMFRNQKIQSVNDQAQILIQDERDSVVNFFKKNLEVDVLEDVGGSYYQKAVTIDSLTSAKEEIWSLWKEANESRLATFPMANEDGVQFSWSIPQNQNMKIYTLLKGAQPSKGYPFFIDLHGGGGDPRLAGPQDLEINTIAWEGVIRGSRRVQVSPNYFFIPRMADDRIGRWYLKPQQTAWLRTWQLAVLSGRADPNRTYITGFSEGGYGSFRMGPFFADYFAAIGPSGAAELEDTAPIENLRNTAIRIEVGESDTGFGRNKLALDWKRRLDSAATTNPGDFNHVVVIQAGRGHGVSLDEMYPWLYNQTRILYPKNLSFMYYEIDGGYRKGFGYVGLNKLSRTAGRKTFKIEKTGNTYLISTKDISGSVIGSIDLYLDQIDYTAPVKVVLNGIEVFNDTVTNNVGVMLESIATFGDPERIYSAKVEVKIP